MCVCVFFYIFKNGKCKLKFTFHQDQDTTARINLSITKRY